MRQRNLRFNELGQKLHKNTVRQITCPKQIITKINPKTIDQTVNRSLINGIVNIQNVLSFLKNAKVNEGLENSIIMLLNSYTQDLETCLHTNQISISSKIEKKSSLSYLSVKIVSNQETNQKKQLQYFDQQISQHRKNTQIENINQYDLLNEKEKGINKLSKQNLKKINQSKGFLPQINKKSISKNLQVFVSVKKQNQKESQNLTQKRKKPSQGIFEKKDTNTQEQRILKMQLKERVKEQVLKTTRQIKKEKEVRKNGQPEGENKHQFNQNLKDHICKAEKECKFVDSAHIITKLNEEIANHLILVQALNTKLVQFQEHQTQIDLDKSQQMKMQKNQTEINEIFEINQLKLKQQSFLGKNQEINQRNEEIITLKQQLKQRQQQITNLWIVIQRSNYPFLHSLT